MYTYIYTYIYIWALVATSCDLNAVHHQSPAGTFTRVPGRCLRWSPTPPRPRWSPAVTRYIYIYIRYNEAAAKFYVYSDDSHTHTHTLPGWFACNEVKMKMKRGMNMKWKWKWDERLLSRGPRRGTQKKREGANTHTNTPGPERANPERAREKKSRGRRTRNKTSGGGDGSAGTNLPQRNLRLLRHAQDPTYLGREERMK